MPGFSSSNQYQRSVPSLQLSQRGVHFFLKCRYRGFPTRMVYLQHNIYQRYTILVRNPRYGTGMYRKQQQVKPLSVTQTDIFRNDLTGLAAATPPCWPTGKASASRAAGSGSIPAFTEDLFLVRVIPVT